jgi:4-hydroxy-tetrahydrodipicolinate synthase
MTMQNYKLWTAVVTPLLDNGSVDFESLTKVVSEQVEAHNGLLILGSTGEALNLSLTVRKSIIEHVVNMKTAMPIMVGIGGNLLEEQKEWMTYLATLPVHSYLLVTPHYAKPGAKGQHDWFKALMDHSTRPCMLYNVPGRTGIAMSTEAVSRLNTHKNFWAIKEASGSVEKFKEYLAAAGGKQVFCGDDGLMPDFAMAGSAGLVSVASNAWPKETNLYVQQCLAKTFDAKELWTKAANSLFVASNPVPVKRLMFERGTIHTPRMAAPLTHEDMASSAPVMEAQEAITRWYNSQKGA